MGDFESLNELYDAIIIGAGMGGLNCAAHLALADKKVLVLEKNPFIGGRCSSYKKDGFTVDYGIHIFANGEDGPLNEPIRRAQSYFKQPLLTWNRIGAKIYYKNSAMQVYSPVNLLHLGNLFKSGWNFLKFKAPWKDKFAFLNMSSKLFGYPPSKYNEIANLTVKEFIDRYTKSDLVHNIYATLSASYAVVAYNKAAAQDFVAVCKNTLGGKGISYPVGGAGAIAEAYRKIIEFKGGHVVTSVPVEKILTDNTHEGYKAIGVKIKQKQDLFAKITISNVDWKTMSRNLLESNSFSSDYITKINNLESSFSTTAVHLALDKKLIDERFVVNAQTIRMEVIEEQMNSENFTTNKGCFMTFPSNIDPALAPPGKQLILGGQAIPYEHHPNTQKYAEVILDYIAKLLKPNVNLKDHIEWINIMGPLELNALFGEKGATVGLAQKIGQIRNDRLESRTPIAGLYHCGDDSGKGLFGVGTELAALSGQKCAEKILEDTNLNL